MRRSFTRLAALLAIVVLVAGCSGDGVDTSAGEASTTAATTAMSAPTTTTPPPTTTRATTSASTTSTSEAVDADVWDLVYISDSSGWGVADEYAARIEGDLGVELEVHDVWGGGLPALVILEALRGERRLPTFFRGAVDIGPLIEEAEVIVVYGNPEASEKPEHPWDWNCALSRETVPVCDEPTSCGPETFTQFQANLVPSSMRSSLSVAASR